MSVKFDLRTRITVNRLTIGLGRLVCSRSKTKPHSGYANAVALSKEEYRSVNYLRAMYVYYRRPILEGEARFDPPSVQAAIAHNLDYFSPLKTRVTLKRLLSDRQLSDFDKELKLIPEGQLGLVKRINIGFESKIRRIWGVSFAHFGIHQIWLNQLNALPHEVGHIVFEHFSFKERTTIESYFYLPRLFVFTHVMNYMCIKISLLAAIASTLAMPLVNMFGMADEYGPVNIKDAGLWLFTTLWQCFAFFIVLDIGKYKVKPEAGRLGCVTMLNEDDDMDTGVVLPEHLPNVDEIFAASYALYIKNPGLYERLAAQSEGHAKILETIRGH